MSRYPGDCDCSPHNHNTLKGGSGDDDDRRAGIDQKALKGQQELQRQEEALAVLESAVASQEVELKSLQISILKQKLVQAIQSLQKKPGSTKAIIAAGVDD